MEMVSNQKHVWVSEKMTTCLIVEDGKVRFLSLEHKESGSVNCDVEITPDEAARLATNYMASKDFTKLI